MKEVKAVIVPNKLDAVHRALRALPGFPGMSVAKVEGYTGAALAAANIRDELTDHRHRLLLVMVLADELADKAHDVLVQAASSGAPGEASVWITEVVRASFVSKTV